MASSLKVVRIQTDEAKPRWAVVWTTLTGNQLRSDCSFDTKLKAIDHADWVRRGVIQGGWWDLICGVPIGLTTLGQTESKSSAYRWAKKALDRHTFVVVIHDSVDGWYIVKTDY